MQSICCLLHESVMYKHRGAAAAPLTKMLFSSCSAGHCSIKGFNGKGLRGIKDLLLLMTVIIVDFRCLEHHFQCL